MRNDLLLLAVGAMTAMSFACTKVNSTTDPDPDPDPDPEPEVPVEVVRLEFDSATLAQSLGDDFDTFCTEYSQYAKDETSSDEGVFVMNGIVLTGDEEIEVSIEVAEDLYGEVCSIKAIPEDSDNDMTLWSYYLNNYDSLNLGSWLGAKYNIYSEDGSSSGGICYDISDALSIVSTNDVEALKMQALFSVVPGKAYAVPSFVDGRFKMQIVYNFLRLDYEGVLYSLIGTSYDDLTEQYDIIGNKMSLWGSYYFYIDYTLDFEDNIFNCDINTDSDQSVITSISLVVDSSYSTDEQLEIWKQYAGGSDKLGLGDFKAGYTSSFGYVGTEFDTLDDVVNYVNTNGRPSGGFDPDIVMEFGTETVTLTVTLKSLALNLSIEGVE